ncbi:MAG: TlpA disulfide reductase family protein [Steroidobacteraceae bacterium]
MKTTAVAALVVTAALAGAAAWFAWDRHGAAPPAPADTAPPLQLAAQVPDFTLVDRDGRPRTLADWKGKSLIVNFWATWCAPCRREIPLLAELQQAYGPAGFQVIGIAADYRDKVLAYADEAKIAYPVLIGEQEALDAAAAYGVEVVGFPFTIFSDAQGRVVAAHVGELTRPQAEVILAAIEAVNAGRRTLEETRQDIANGLARLPRSPEATG